MTDRASLQARADGEARIALLPAYRVAGLLTDALVARSEGEEERAFDRLPAFRLKAFAELDALNAALADSWRGPAMARAGRKQGSRARDRRARSAGRPRQCAAGAVLHPRFVPPRRAAGELTLSPGASSARPQDDALRLGSPSAPSDSGRGRPRSRPGADRAALRADFAAARDDDPPVQVEIVGLRLAAANGPPPMLAVGAWRGMATVAPGRLRFAVPRGAFTTDAARTVFAAATLSVRSPARTATFRLLFTVLPDRPGAFALDQRVQTTMLEAKTLVSPEILVRAPPAGETRTVRRCFDPPPDWRFDQERRRVVVVERLGWQDDIGDATLNGGSVEFVPEERPGQICVAVSARPVNPLARTATIGRFEATLVRDQPVEQVVKSVIRALDWREPAGVPIEPGMAEWKLYVRLFDEIDREFDAAPASAAFLRISRDGDGPAIVLQADPAAEP